MFVLLFLLFTTTVGTMKIVCERGGGGGEYDNYGGKNGGLGGCVWMCFVSFLERQPDWQPPGPGAHLDCMLVHTAESLVTEWGTVVCDPHERSRILMKIPLFKEPGLRLEEYLAQNIHDDGPGGIITRQGRIVFDRWGINDTLSFRFHYS